MVGFVVPEKDILGNQVAIEIPQRLSSWGRNNQLVTDQSYHNDDAEYVPIGSGHLIDISDDYDDEGLSGRSAAEDVIAARIAAEEIMR